MLPFTVEQFLGVFVQYNQAIWPMHIAAYLLGIATLVLALTRPRYADQAISIILAMLWAWMGVVYHLIFFRPINPAALGFGALFIVQAALWVVFGVVRPRLSFKAELNPYSVTGAVLIAYAMIVYPVIGALLGHGYPASPSFGVAPCPTTIFTFGLLLCTNVRVPKPVLVIPLIWSLIGFYAAVSLGIGEDIGLLLAGLVCAGLLFWRDRPRPHTSKREHYA